MSNTSSATANVPTTSPPSSTGNAIAPVTPGPAQPQRRPATWTLKWWQFISVVLIGIFTVGGFLMVVTTQQQVSDGAVTFNRYVQVQQVKSLINRSMSIAVNNQLTGAGQSDSALTPLATASRQVVEAGAFGYNDQRLFQLQDSLVTYAFRIGALRANEPNPTALEAASAELERTSALATGIYESAREKLQSQRSTLSFLPLLWTALFAAPLVWIAVALARRSKRVINLGMAVALAAVLGAGTVTYAASLDGQQSVSSAMVGPIEKARRLADARTALNQAKYAEARSLLTGNNATFESQWRSNWEQANQAIATNASRSSTDTKALMSAYAEAHERVVSLASSGKKAEAIASSARGDSHAAFVKADDAIRLLVEAEQTAARDQIEDPLDNLAVLKFVLIVLGAAAGAFAWWGIGARIRSYQ